MYASYSYVSPFVKKREVEAALVYLRAMMTSRLMHTVAPAFHVYATRRVGSDELHEQILSPFQISLIHLDKDNVQFPLTIKLGWYSQGRH